MVNISRDNDGKTRIAKGDKTGLGGQYAPDTKKLAAAKHKMDELATALFNDDEKIVYEIWYDTQFESGKLSYAPNFYNEMEAKRYVKDFMENSDPGDEIRSLSVMAARKTEDGSLAGYVDPTGEIAAASGYAGEPISATMSLEDMVELIREEWSDSMSDNGAIWKKTNEKLKKAKLQYPALYEKALPIARELGR